MANVAKCLGRKASASKGRGLSRVEAKGDGRMEGGGTTKTIVNKTGAVLRKGGDKRG